MTERKCRECKWLTGKRASVGIECMNPEKQEKWKRLDIARMSVGGWATTARYKQPSGFACKKFEEKEDVDKNR